MRGVREAGFEVGLDGSGASGDEPGTIGQLIPQEPLNAFSVDRVGDRHAAGTVERVERFTCSVGIARNAGELTPASIGILRRRQGLNRGGEFGLSGA